MHPSLRAEKLIVSVQNVVCYNLSTQIAEKKHFTFCELNNNSNQSSSALMIASGYDKNENAPRQPLGS